MFRFRRREDESANQTSGDQADGRTDSVTRLPNSQYFAEAVEREVARGFRTGLVSSIVVIEIDPVPANRNDLLEDPTLARAVAARLRRAVRATDLVARLDTWHFAVLLPDCDDDGANEFRERLRTALSRTPFPTSDGRRVYLVTRVGAATWDPSIRDVSSFLQAAIRDLQAWSAAYRDVAARFRGPAMPS